MTMYAISPRHINFKRLGKFIPSPIISTTNGLYWYLAGELYDWLMENKIDYRIRQFHREDEDDVLELTIKYRWISNHFAIIFENENDALLYKLRWE